LLAYMLARFVHFKVCAFYCLGKMTPLTNQLSLESARSKNFKHRSCKEDEKLNLTYKETSG